MGETVPKYAFLAGDLYVYAKTVNPAVVGEGERIVLCRAEGAPCNAEDRYVPESRWLSAATEFFEGARESGIVTSQSSTQEKLALYRSLFCGRQDVHAHGYRKRDGGIGYAPECANEWHRGVCPRVSGKKVGCADCSQQAFFPLDDRILIRHFKGEDECLRDVVGLYVLDGDSKTHLLVLDFDDEGWEAAVKAVRAAARARGIETHVERSRSGCGGHIWFFFETAISAKLARAFGNALIEEAMTLSNSVGFDAFDRMFPAQETIPTGGFGNLIAAPLQGQPQRSGNSVFVNDAFEAYPDQWLYLSRVRKLSEQTVQAVVAPSADGAQGALKSESEPWKRKPVEPLSPDDFPKALVIVEADMIYVPEQGLSPRAAQRIKRMAAFSNPEFFRRQALHRSVYGTPRIAYLGETREGFIALPRGCKRSLTDMLNGYQVGYSMRDERQVGNRFSVEFTGELRPGQREAADRLVRYENGILSAPTGFGKTVIGAWLIARASTSTLVIVPNTALATQWACRLAEFLAIEHPGKPLLTPSGKPSKRKRPVIGQIGGGKNRISGIVDIATYQSLVEKDPETGEPRAKELVKSYGMVICDECHHAAAPQLELILKAVPAKFVYGLSATPNRSDHLDRALYMLCGPIRCRIDPKELAREQGFKRILKPRLTQVRLGCEPGSSYTQVLDKLCEHAARNDFIAKDVAKAVGRGRSALVLTKRKAHARVLFELISNSAQAQTHLLVGEGTARQRRENLDAAVAAMDEGPAVLVATEAYLGEGFDASRLDTLFLATPISWDGTVTQQAGRLHRVSEGKFDVVIYDYVDATEPMLERMYKKRLKTYAKLAYEVDMPACEGAGEGAAAFVTWDEAMGKLSADIAEASSCIMISAPYASAMAIEVLAGSLSDAKLRGVDVTCVLAKQASDEARAAFAKTGLSLVEGESLACPGLAVFDRKLVWYGTIPLLAFAKKDDCSIRFEGAEAAHDLLEGLGLDATKVRYQLPCDADGQSVCGNAVG